MKLHVRQFTFLLKSNALNHFLSPPSILIGFLNMRGADIAYNPVFFGYVLITLDDVCCFVKTQQLPANYEQHFSKNNVTIKVSDYENVQVAVKNEIDSASHKVWISPTSSYNLSALVPDKKLFLEVNSPVINFWFDEFNLKFFLTLNRSHRFVWWKR